MHFESPWAFLLLILIPLLPVARKMIRRRGSIRFPSTGNAAKAGRSLRQRFAVVHHPMLAGLRVGQFETMKERQKGRMARRPS